jgi:hypothetical protein
MAFLTREGLVPAVERKVGAVVIEGLPIQRYRDDLSALVFRVALPACTCKLAMKTGSRCHSLLNLSVAGQAFL